MNRKKIIEHMVEVLDEAPVHRLGESLDSFLERYKEWYRSRRFSALEKYSQLIAIETGNLY